MSSIQKQSAGIKKQKANINTASSDHLTKAKICGLRSTADAEIINRHPSDFAGVILAHGFRRTIDHETAKQIREVLNEQIPLVGVFFNDSVETILRFLNEGIIQIAQLHGQESDDFVQELKAQTDAVIWKVFQMKQPDETLYEVIHNSSADMVLLDAGTGSGESFDWSLLDRINRPYILAGGLQPNNVTGAIAQTHPYAVDTSSGVETDGRKDEEKIDVFLRNVYMNS